MKNVYTLTFSLLILLLMSCEKHYGKYIEAVTDITVLNQQGQNLLADPATYSKKDINIYYVINGQSVLYDKSLLSTDRGIEDKGFHITNEGTPIIRIYLNFDINRKDTHPVTLIKFGTSKIDTINTEFEYIGRSVFLRKIWFNGVEKKQEFTIIK